MAVAVVALAASGGAEAGEASGGGAAGGGGAAVLGVGPTTPLDERRADEAAWSAFSRAASDIDATLVLRACATHGNGADGSPLGRARLAADVVAPAGECRGTAGGVVAKLDERRAGVGAASPFLGAAMAFATLFLRARADAPTVDVWVGGWVGGCGRSTRGENARGEAGGGLAQGAACQ